MKTPWIYAHLVCSKQCYDSETNTGLRQVRSGAGSVGDNSAQDTSAAGDNKNMALIKEDNGDASADASTRYTIEPGDVFQGTLDPAGDNDWIKIELNAGTIYDIRLDGVELDQFRLFNPSGDNVIYGPYLLPYTTLYRAYESGTYYVAIARTNYDDSDNYEISFLEHTLSVASYDEIAAYLKGTPENSRLYDVEPGGTLTADITALTSDGQQLARWALEAWTYVTGIKFEFVDSGNPHIIFDDEELGVGFSSHTSESGVRLVSFINIGSDWLSSYGNSIDSATFYAYLHEIGHALGLNHPGPYDAPFPYTNTKIFGNDSYQTSVMSYKRQDSDNFTDASFAYPVTPMIVDIIAIHDLYGTPVDINPGDTVYGHDSNVEGYLAELFERWTGQGDASFGNPVTLTLYDSGGIDTLDLSTDSSNQRVDLRPEGISDVYGLVGNLVIARDTLIENFIAGSGDDTIIGNNAANHLEGRDGNDELRGNGGNDILEGGNGADRMNGGAGMDWISYQGSDAGVTINLLQGTLTGGHAEGDVIIDIENIIGSGYGDVLEGDSGANRLHGGPGNDELSGNDGDDTLEGGAGADRLTGGAGEDVASYEHSDAAVTVRLHSGVVQGGDAEDDMFAGMVTVAYTGAEGETQEETVPDIEHLRGSAYDDLLAGDSRANRLEGGNGNDKLYGGPGGGDDALWGGPGEDALFGGIGDDMLWGGPDADTLRGGPGADTASYAQSDAGVTVRLHDGTVRGGHAEGDDIADMENVRGSAHADILEGDEGANRLDGSGGADELRGNGGDDVLEGGSGDDVMEGGAGADRLDGGTGVDWLSYAGSDGPVSVRLYDGYAARGHAEGDTISGFENLRGSDYPDVLSGSGRANRLEGGAGNDRMGGGSGNDVLEGGAGADRLDGGPGTDWLSYAGSDGPVSVRLYDGYTGRGHAEGDTISGFENLRGSDYPDALAGSGGANRLEGGAGDDRIRGAGGDDILDGGPGADRLDGGAGIDTAIYRGSNEAVTVNLSDGTALGGHAEGDVFTSVERIIGSVYGDTLVGSDGADRLDGNSGNDFLEGGAGADRLDGGAGMDMAVYRNSPAAITVNLGDGTLTGGHAEGDVIINIEGIEGSAYDDVLIGDNGRNRLEGGDGDDELRGNDGADWLFGGGGNDLLEGGDRRDVLDGGPGIDTLSYENSTLPVGIYLPNWAQTISGNYTERISGFENIIGSDYGDTLQGDIGVNEIYGRGGNDLIRGMADDDRLFGEAGDDRLEGGAGADRLHGGEGADTAYYWFSDKAVTVNLEDRTAQGGHADGDVLVEIENLLGSDHDDILTGDEGANRLSGRRGNDELKGGKGADHFVFYFSGGNDTILDFTDNEDLIDLFGFWNISGFDDLTILSDANGVIIDLSGHDGGTILLQGFDIANLDASDFIFF